MSEVAPLRSRSPTVKCTPRHLRRACHMLAEHELPGARIWQSAPRSRSCFVRRGRRSGVHDTGYCLWRVALGALLVRRGRRHRHRPQKPHTHSGSDARGVANKFEFTRGMARRHHRRAQNAIPPCGRVSSTRVSPRAGHRPSPDFGASSARLDPTSSAPGLDGIECRNLAFYPRRRLAPRRRCRPS